MKIGIPREIKVLEGRVALTPAAVRELVSQGHDVFVEQNAGKLSGFSDALFSEAGAVMLESAELLYAQATLIVKVKEPQAAELNYLRADHLLFSYLHLAAEPELTRALVKIGLTAVAFETVTDNGHLPLLAPMSDIAGRISVQIGAHLLHQPQGGRGILLGGVSGSEINKGQVVILGGGVAGSGAAVVAAALGANVTVFDPNPEKQQRLQNMGQNVIALAPDNEVIGHAVKTADLLIGSVLLPGARTPHLVSAGQVKSMKAGSVIVDISVDQGGCIETTRPTTYESPTFVWEGVIHFGVTNMPGAVPRTASQALSSALLPYVLKLTEPDWEKHIPLKSGVNVKDGEIKLQSLL